MLPPARRRRGLLPRQRARAAAGISRSRPLLASCGARPEGSGSSTNAGRSRHSHQHLRVGTRPARQSRRRSAPTTSRGGPHTPSPFLVRSRRAAPWERQIRRGARSTSVSPSSRRRATALMDSVCFAPSSRRNRNGHVPHQKLSSKAGRSSSKRTRRPAQVPGCFASSPKRRRAALEPSRSVAPTRPSTPPPYRTADSAGVANGERSALAERRSRRVVSADRGLLGKEPRQLGNRHAVKQMRVAAPADDQVPDERANIPLRAGNSAMRLAERSRAVIGSIFASSTLPPSAKPA